MKKLKTGILTSAVAIALCLSACSGGSSAETNTSGNSSAEKSVSSQSSSAQTDVSSSSAEQTEASSKSEADQGVKGEQGTAGKISVFVPEGYELNMGSITSSDADDETQCYIIKAYNDYIWIITKDSEEEAKSDSELTKEINDAEDCTVTAGDTTWKGCTYKYSTYDTNFNSIDIDCGALYATKDGVAYLVNFCTGAYDSKEMLAILSSITAA